MSQIDYCPRCNREWQSVDGKVEAVGICHFCYSEDLPTLGRDTLYQEIVWLHISLLNISKSHQRLDADLTESNHHLDLMIEAVGIGVLADALAGEEE